MAKPAGKLVQSPAMDRLARILAGRLREERRRRRFSLRKLADASGLSPTTIHQIETGRGSPSLATLHSLASTLGVPLAPGGDTGQGIIHPGRELVFGLAGRCVYEVAGKRVRIGPGDSLSVDSRQPHRGRNPGRREARLLLVLCAPDEEPSWMERHTRPAR